MKLTFLLFLIPMISKSQDVKSPSVMILNPQEFFIEETIPDSTPNYTLSDEQIANCKTNSSKDEDRDFVIKMNEMECEFMRTMDTPTALTSYLNTWMTFKLYGVFDDAIIFPVRMGERSKSDYKLLAENYEVNWIVNLRKVEILTEADSLRGIVNVELWNKNTNEITLSTSIELDDKNYGGEMSCDDGTINCIMINGSVYITHNLLKNMFSNEKYWR